MIMFHVPNAYVTNFLIDSRAIMEYFVDKYAKDDSLCPNDPKKRAKMHQMLYFDGSTLFKRFLDYFVCKYDTLSCLQFLKITQIRPGLIRSISIFQGPVMSKQMAPSPEALEKIEEALGFFDSFLDGRSWAAGDDITIADYTLAVTVSNLEAVGVDISKYPKVDIWYTKAKAAIPGFEEINSNGVQMFKEIMNSSSKN
ncbi:hypothetical protein PR048_006228 [Dryococelus australis]|uniref:GST C-terminal domain-containing protein n=1 Tax=Dryococelus australis TaxID=614101 RepID=A0ABQ9IAD0_9NEOP|nr:hypothetical protein PR048_006228 [Dryococelus australis]